MKKTSSQINTLRNQLKSVRSSDFFQLERRLKRLLKSESRQEAWNALERDIELSIKAKADRKQNKPECQFAPDLPINQRIETITDALENNQVVIICGETGSGKTTQLPKMCLQMGRGLEGIIGHTQPRRIAAKSVAKRIADELGSDLGKYVGYKIRHQDKTQKDSYIKLMTDGILLAELQQDRYLNQYDTLIIDEAHERSLNIDFILGYLKHILVKRPDLKLIITSATIDVNRFSEHFNDAPVIEVSGRSWPVDVLYRPLKEDDDEQIERERHILNIIDELSAYDMGDILIFMEGEGEIHETDKFLRKQNLSDTDILPLYARLSSSRQNKIFAPHKRRHIVLATNVAETSLTIPGIRYVIDTGMARFSRYSYRSKVQRLPIEKISRAAANQRKGRCGRTSEGICVRLYSEEDFEARVEFTQPEILRTNLASVILQMKTLKLGDIENYPFIDPPDRKFINDGLRLLREINALDTQDRLTPIGKKLARLPLDPRHARILLAASDFNCLNEALIIISALSIQDPRERPVDKTEKADKAHQQFADENSDFLWFINLWKFYHKQIKKLSQNKLRKLCQQNFLSYIRIREWLDIHRQLRHICTELGLSINSEPASYQNIHCAILSGMPSQVAFLSDKHEYTGARNIRLHVFPASSQFHKKPKWIVAAELTETSRLFARTVARIESQWLLNTAKHLLKRSYSAAQWESKSARVLALENTSLYGMTLLASRKVNYGPINPGESKTLFIRHALIAGDFISSADFYKHNIKLIEQIRRLETKSRRPDILDEDALYDFYMQNLPNDVYDGQSFSTWVKTLNKEQKKSLFLTDDSIMHHAADAVNHVSFPDVIQAHGVTLALQYKFEPGAVEDGLNLDVPLEILKQFNDVQMDYLVPGLLEEKISILLKSLPKQIRKTLVPIPGVAKECMQNMTNRNISLKKNLAHYLFKTRELEIKDEDWSGADMPAHLQVNYRVVDEANNVLDEGKELACLQQRYATESETAFNELFDANANSDEITDWDFGDLPVSKEVKSGAGTITIYPALIEEEGKVFWYAFDNQADADTHLKQGLLGLFKLSLAKEIKYLRKNLQNIEKLSLLYANIGSKDDLLDSIVNVAVERTFLYEEELIRSQERFLAILEYGKSRLLLNAGTVCTLLEKTLTLYRDVLACLLNAEISQDMHSLSDIEEQLEYMFFNGFIEDVPFIYLQEYPRYLESILKRMQKLKFAKENDRKNTLLLKGHWDRIKKLVDAAYETGDFSTKLNEYRWMIEELRVSLFTQELKTKSPVSIKRMDRLWETVQKEN